MPIRQYTNNVIQNILDNHWDGNIPVDLEGIAARLNIQLKQETDGNISGSASIDGFNRPVATFNPWESHVRQRFTIAHELGHILLGHVTADNTRYRADNSSNFSLGEFDPLEVQANDFAAKLLMPLDAIEYYVYKSELTSIADLAREFNVSEAAMYFRLKNLNII